MNSDEPFSPALKRVLNLAQQLAQQTPDASLARDSSRAGNPISPEHLFWAMLLDEDNSGAMKLKALGFNPSWHNTPYSPASVTASSANVLDDAEPRTSEAIVLDDPATHVMYQVRQFAFREGNYQDPGCEELLVSLVDHWPGSEEVFARHGLQLAELRTHLPNLNMDTKLPVTDDMMLKITDQFDHTDMVRMVDANLNRAREGLRVAEDYARFALDDAETARKMKELRHDIRSALEFLPEHWLAAARETTTDVGIDIRTPDEYRRSGLLGIAIANFKRAQEAVRTLEELAKVESYYAAELLEKIRYQLYTLEKSVLTAQRSQSKLAQAMLYWLVDPNQTSKAVHWMLCEAIEGGVDVVQLRMKNANDRELLEQASYFRKWTRELGTLLIINDRADIARIVQADGVHVGQDDLNCRQVRKIVGTEMLVGVSTHNLDDARRAVDNGANYLGCGPVFPSHTKEFADFPGLNFVRELADLSLGIPIYCLGGINTDNVQQVLEAGGKRIAVSQAISKSTEPRNRAIELKQALLSAN